MTAVIDRKALILCLAITALAGGTDAGATPVEEELLAAINAARVCPACYAKQALEPYRAAFTGAIAKRPSGNLRTEEGVRAVDDAIAELALKRPVRPLKASAGLARAARDHVSDITASGITGHEGSDGSTPQHRIERYGRWGRVSGENIAFVHGGARELLLQLIVDDGVPGRGHRRNIFNPDFTVAGVACASHTVYATVCVIDFAGSFLPGPVSVSE